MSLFFSQEFAVNPLLVGRRMQQSLKETPLYQWHTSHGAKMAEFGGYSMPLWYSGPKTEHIAVVTSIGIFDTSHMAVIMVEGSGSFDLLQLCFTRDLRACICNSKGPIKQGSCVYGAFLNEKGEAIDDAIVYKISDDAYMVVVNAGMGAGIARHLADNKREWAVAVTNLTGKVGKFDIQGPLSAKILKKVLKHPARVLEHMPYFSFKGHFTQSHPLSRHVQMSDGTCILLSRTGYTGEFGFEVFIDSSYLVSAWQIFVDAGCEINLVPCGLAARDSLRTGALLPLSHQDIGPWPFCNHPWTFALPFNHDKANFTKSFIGADALMSASHSEYTYAFAGFDPRKIAVCEQAKVLDSKGTAIGVALTCTTDMAIDRHAGKIYSIASPNKPNGFIPRGLSCGFVRVKRKLAPDHVVVLKDNRREIKVEIVDTIRPNRTAYRSVSEML